MAEKKEDKELFQMVRESGVMKEIGGLLRQFEDCDETGYASAANTDGTGEWGTYISFKLKSGDKTVFKVSNNGNRLFLKGYNAYTKRWSALYEIQLKKIGG